MSKQGVITLRIPSELKERVVDLSSEQGVSINQWIMYALTEKVTESETRKFFQSRRSERSKAEVLAAVDIAMAKVQSRPVPEWDSLPEMEAAEQID